MDGGNRHSSTSNSDHRTRSGTPTAARCRPPRHPHTPRRKPRCRPLNRTHLSSSFGRPSSHRHRRPTATAPCDRRGSRPPSSNSSSSKKEGRAFGGN